MDVSLKSSREVFSAGPGGKYFNVQESVFDVDGSERPPHYIWNRGDFVVVLCMTKDDDLVIIKQYKFAVQKELWGFPSGAVEPGEDPLEAAKRELFEETGYTGTDWDQVGPAIYNSPDKILERHFVFTCLGKKEELETPNELITEILEVSSIRFSQMLAQGEFCVSVALAALYLVINFGEDE